MVAIYEENVEWIFSQDIREKKLAGNGIHGRAARLRKHETVKMPSEQTQDKFQRRLILGAGPVYSTTLKEMKCLELLEKVRAGEWLTIEELKALPFEDGQKVYAEIRRLHTTAEIYKGLDCAAKQVSELSWSFQVARSGKQIIVGEPALDVLRGFAENRQNQVKNKDQTLEQKQEPEKPKRKYKARESSSSSKPSLPAPIHEQIEPNNITLVEVKKPEIEPFRISVKNVFSSDQVIALFTRLQLFVEGQSGEFEISLNLQERLS